jgi:predicted nucleotidyltransferase
VQVELVVQQVRTPAQMVVQVLSREQASQLCLQLVAVAQVSPGETVALVVVQQVDQQLVHQALLELERLDKVLTVVPVAMETVPVLLRNGVAAVAVAQVQLVALLH